MKGSAADLYVLKNVLHRKGMRTVEVFAALDAGPTFAEACQESISTQAGIGNKDTPR